MHILRRIRLAKIDLHDLVGGWVYTQYDNCSFGVGRRALMLFYWVFNRIVRI